MKRPCAILLSGLLLLACSPSNTADKNRQAPADSGALPPDTATLADAAAPPPDRCTPLDEFVSFLHPDSIRLSVRRNAAWDTSRARPHVDSSETETYRLARTVAGTVYFTYGLSYDPEFLITRDDSVFHRPDGFRSVKDLKSAYGTELRIHDDSTLELCGNTNAYTNRSRTYRVVGDSLVLLRSILLDSAMARTTTIALDLFHDSLLARSACRIPRGARVRVTRTLLHPAREFNGEAGVFFVESAACSGWFDIQGSSAVGTHEPITGLFFHGD